MEQPSKKIIARRWLFVAPLSVALGWLLSWLNVPAAWILGAIAVSGACALITGEELPLNKYVFGFGRGIVAILAALPLAASTGGELVRYLLPGIFVAVVTVGVGVLGGLLLARSQKSISPETGVLSMLAGGASMMPVLARDLGADFRYVALSQYLRLLAVSVTLPLVSHLFAPPGAPDDPQGSGVLGLGASISIWTIVVILGIILVGEPLGKLLRLPAAAVLGPMLVTIAVSFVLPDGVSMDPPVPFTIIAFMVIGWMCGGALSIPALKMFTRQLPATFLFIFLLMAVCAASGAALMAWLDISYFEAYLATSPGALETVLALSSEGNAGPVVVAIQIIRLMAVLAIAGWLPSLLRLILRRGI